MRIVLLADIHGNALALEAVLADIKRKGHIDGYWILGDLVALGPDPNGVLEQLMRLPGLQVIRGNTDRYVVSGDRPSPTLEEAREDSRLLPPLVEVANTFAWTQGMVTASGWLQWLKDLPVELSISLPDGSRFLGVHASPGRDDGPGIAPEMKDSDIQKFFGSCDANLVCMGHTHLPMERRWNGIHLVNPGAVSLSLTPNRNACYAILEAAKEGYSISHHEVSFDHQHVIDQLNQLGHPGRAFLIRHLSVR
ncbi:MAG: metallophosphoesterase family protein [Chitinophaga sp.]|uniref:metallophosphoesterase family protein n=1 Tax=Chitinophaga sp. TaxID=1869181 RepID=UPI001B0A8A03|nr:metallophosphoesterase family protein [Chitinophaga sp.]MBO9731036.1 metallophosphoesterase family protein [Chitinophaga sp.]